MDTLQKMQETIKEVSPINLEILGANAEALDHKEWLTIRTKGMGGSDIANIMGVPGAFGSPLSTYMSKIGEPESIEESEPMRWGSILEETIRNEYAHRTGYDVRVVDATLINPDHPHRRANTDGFVNVDGEWGILEIKNVGFSSGDWANNQVPPKYYAQVQWYMFITGLKFAKVVALANGQQLLERHIDINPDFVDAMVEATDNFWQLVLTKNPPPSSGNPRCAEVLKTLYPPTDETIVELDEHTELLNSWLEASTQEKYWKKQKDQYSNKIFELVGNHKKATFDGKSVVSHSITNRASIDKKLLEEKYPEIAKECTKVSESQFFRITYKGKK